MNIRLNFILLMLINILKKVHDLGLNVSKVCENVLKVSIDALENRNKQTLYLTGVSLGKEKPKEAMKQET